MGYKNTSITLPEDMLKKAEAAAREEGRTKSELFREALRRYLFQKRFPLYSEKEIVKTVKETRDKLWRERYGKKIGRIS